MRIVAGELGGRVIESPSEKTTRPTTDRVRESMFSSVYSRIGELDGTDALDAFAGSGALGIEALSRGVRSCTFFERDGAARRVLQGNLAALGLGPARCTVRGCDVLEASRWSATGRPLGLVLLDPPYALDAGEVRGLLERIAGAGELADGALAVYEHALGDRVHVAEAFADGAFSVNAQRKYGKIAVSYIDYRKEGRACAR